MKKIFLCSFLAISILSCKKENNETEKINKNESEQKLDLSFIEKKGKTNKKESEQKLDLPFIGKREFETRPGYAGSGTPVTYVEITKDGNVFFGFVQENQANGKITRDRYFAGKFKRTMKCIFKDWDETTYYRITKDKIYEVDKDNKLIVSEDCCTSNNLDAGGNCPCESDLN